MAINTKKVVCTTPGTVNTSVSASYPAKDSVIVREPAAKKNVMTFN